MENGFPQDPGMKREVGYCKPPVEHQFKPGNRANPGGRPKGQSLTALLRRRLEAVADEATGETYAEQFVNQWVNAALDGNVPAIKEALDRTEGKVPDKIKATLNSSESADHALAVVLKALEGFPEARLEIARQLKESACVSARNGDGARPGDPDGDAWS